MIAKFGSQQRVAELLGIWQTAVSGWVRRGAIPARRQQELLAAAAREGIELSPADFFADIESYAGAAVAAGGGGGQPRRMPAPSHPRHEGTASVMTTSNVVSLKGDAGGTATTATRPIKDLYEIGEIPPLGHVPKNMYAWTIRKERHGDPTQAMQVEVVPTPELDSHDVLIMVMAAGVNYNGVWACLGTPVSVLDFHKQPYHVAGSDATGIVWAIGSKVTRVKVGDEVVVHCNQDDGDDEECNGGDPMLSPSQR
ncbi:MAG: carph-isopro domain-containing protein, partial [Pseudomonadota bacterium]